MKLTRTMNATELERLRAELGLSQAKLAQIFKLDPRTMRRYIAGEQIIPIALAVALRLLVKYGWCAEDLTAKETR